MPTTKSAKKRQRQTVTATFLNKSKKSRISSAKRSFETAVHNGDESKATETFGVLCSALDKAAKNNVINANKANRGKSRAVKALATLKS